ncbi:MAG: oligosaccharide flippase family protein [Geminicoccaceae bacterium]
MAKPPRSFLKDASVILRADLLYVGSRFLISVILARFLGPEGRGILAARYVAPNIVQTQLDLGIRRSLVFHLAREKCPEGKVIANAGLLFFVSSALGMLACAGYLIFLTDNDFPLLLVALVTLTLPLQVSFEYFRGYFLSKENIQLFSLVRVLRSILRIVGFSLLIMVLQGGVVGALLADIITALIVLFIVLRVFWRQAEFTFDIDFSMCRSLLAKGLTYSVSLFVLMLNFRIDVVMLNQLSTVYEIGIYSLAVNWAELMWYAPEALGTLAFAKRANAADDSAVDQKVPRLFRLSFLALMFAAMPALLSPVLFPLIYGQEFAPAGDMFLILLPGVITFSLFRILNGDLSGRGKPLVSLLVSVPIFALNVGLNAYLIPHYGAAGAAMASTLAYVLAAALFLVVYCRVSRIPLSRFLVFQGEDLDFFADKIGRFMPRLSRS